MKELSINEITFVTSAESTLSEIKGVTIFRIAL